MRYIIRLTILALCLIVCTSAYAEDQAGGEKRMLDKLERTRQLMQETPSPSEGTRAAQAVQDSEITSSGMKMVQSLGLLVALVLIGAWVYKKYVLKEIALPARKMKLIERIALSPRASLTLTEVEGVKVLVGMTGDSISMMKIDSSTAPFAVTLDEEYKGE